MKKIIGLAIIVSLSLSSCMFSGHFGKRPLYLVGAPDDIQVKHNGKRIDVEEHTLANGISAVHGNVTERTKYRHPAALVKVRSNNKIELTSGGKTAVLNVKGKAGKGIVFLILEAPITLGIGTIVDLATVSFYYPSSKYVDVDAAFNNTTPKSKAELRKIALDNSSKEVTTEIRTR
jgi:hypothetical protein